MAETIHVVGAGPAGITAAIVLNREGYNVIVHEKERQVGGPPTWHPSIHVTPIDFDRFEEFTGFDVRPAFKDTYDNMKYYVEDEERPFAEWIGEVPNFYATIRGPHPDSLDNYLYQLALSEGVEFRFNEEWGKEDFDNAPQNTIVSIGFGQSGYEALDYKFTPFYGYWTRKKCPKDEVNIAIYSGDYTNEYGYQGSKDGVWYALIFARGDITPEGLDRFAGILKDKTGVEVDKWSRFDGATTRFPRLFDRQFIFAGTASGFIDPAQGYGILSAMLGGKIAAMAVNDPEGAQALHDKYIDAISKHIELKFKPGYKRSIHFREGELWLDIPTKKACVPDYKLED